VTPIELLREINDALVLPSALQAKMDAVLDAADAQEGYCPCGRPLLRDDEQRNRVCRECL
jgi:hypothetical protein